MMFRKRVLAGGTLLLLAILGSIAVFIAVRNHDNEVPVPEFSVAVSLTQKAESHVRNSGQPIFVEVSFVGLLFPKNLSAKYAPDWVQLGSQKKTADTANIARFDTAKVSLKGLKRITNKENYLVRIQVSSAQGANENALSCETLTDGIDVFRWRTVEVHCQLMDEPRPFRVRPEFRMPEVVVPDSDASDPPAVWRALDERVESLKGTSDNPEDYRALDRSVAQVMGGRVMKIRVLRVVRYRTGANKAALAPEARLSEITERVRKVWDGRFFESFEGLPWAEKVLWNLEARVEFEDGRAGVLISDGWHVAMQDHDGKVRFLRLWLEPNANRSANVGINEKQPGQENPVPCSLALGRKSSSVPVPPKTKAATLCSA